jgi:hypothetical protein
MIPVIIAKYGIPALAERLFYMILFLILLIITIIGYMVMLNNEIKNGAIMIGVSLLILGVSTYVWVNYPIALANQILHH